jgi:hypothetical protein
MSRKWLNVATIVSIVALALSSLALDCAPDPSPGGTADSVGVVDSSSSH